MDATVACRAFRIGETDFWAASVDLAPGRADPGEPKINSSNGGINAGSPIALHFVVDNSYSMGTMTEDVRAVFSELVDSAASMPCSLTLFSERASLLSDDIRSSRQMLELPLPYQGSTNIPAGVRQAIEVISQREINEATENGAGKTHHVLILLTDGMHNSGAPPIKEFPQIEKDIRNVIPDVQLSVVLIGITRNSSTSMGMLLKTHLETVPLDNGHMKNVYFASTRSAMKTIMSQLVDGLTSVCLGTIYTISSPTGRIVPEVGKADTSTTNVRVSPEDKALPLLLVGEKAPGHLTINGDALKVTVAEETDHSLIAEILGKQTNKLRIKRVASTDPSAVRPAIQQLTALIDALENDFKKKSGVKLTLAKAHGADRLAQNRKILKAVCIGRELRNQLADVANFSTNCSEEQAAFLTGSQSRYASKALRRAAARTGKDGLLDSQNELARVRCEFSNPSFGDTLNALLRADVTNQLSRLSKNQLRDLEEHVKAASASDVAKLGKITNLIRYLPLPDFDGDNLTETAKQTDQKKVHTSALCWIPPAGETFDDIQTIRQKHDRQIKRWPPHINLLYPFVPSGDFENAAKKLTEALKDVPPFNVTLKDIRNFAHSKKSFTAWLHPLESNEFVRLQATCQASFPFCDDLSKRGEFVAHMTVGQCTSKTSAENLAAEATWESSVSRCGEVCLISRKAHDEPFEVHWCIQLGAGTCIRMPAATTPEENIAETTESDGSKRDLFAEIDPATKDFIDSGTLSGYLNQVFFGERRSYLSLMNPWEHVAEWRDLSKDDQGFQSQWEMLLYAGAAAYPIVIERSAGGMMNPFQLAVKKIHTTVIDTASLCCSNHSEIDTYGPEGGEPIKDALVLVDPSCPKASARVASSALLGETYTSVVLARDLHMYTGAQMKVALHAHSLFRCLQPEELDTSEAEAAAEIRRQFLGRAYQCRSCGFGPVDHGGCSDLEAHHGETDSAGGVASNACPSCGWFSERLSDWDEWDGTIPPALISNRMENRQIRGETDGERGKLLETKADMMLRIVYSFRKIFSGKSYPIWALYSDFAKRLVDWDLRFTTQDEVDGVVQILIAVAACDEDVIGDDEVIDAAFSPPVILAIVNEACARAARKRFRVASGGDEATARELAADRVTEMLSISEESAPDVTESLLEPEPRREVVDDRCRRDYAIDLHAVQSEVDWVGRIGTRWTRSFEIVRALRKSIVRRGGGWTRLERDMETSLEDYADVVRDLCEAPIQPFSEACDIAEYDRAKVLVAMAAQAFLHNKGASRADLPDVRDGETLRELAKDMRMRIYSRRVGEKMKRWTSEGEDLALLRARAADIGQYAEMVYVRAHVHGLSREMFWGLWEAAVFDGFSGEKVRTFLETANPEFCSKYAPREGEVRGREKKRQT